ncbi:hypothetical protein GJ744_007423, partial [Endocarpon pusillum]
MQQDRRQDPGILQPRVFSVSPGMVLHSWFGCSSDTVNAEGSAGWKARGMQILLH